MSDEFTKTVASLIGISTLAAACRSILSEDRRSLKGFARASMLAVFVGGVAGGLIQQYHFASETQGSIIGLCAFVADDILMALVSLASWFRSNPGRIIDVILGRKIE